MREGEVIMAKQLCERLRENIMSENYIVINGKRLDLAVKFWDLLTWQENKSYFTLESS